MFKVQVEHLPPRVNLECSKGMLNVQLRVCLKCFKEMLTVHLGILDELKMKKMPNFNLKGLVYSIY
jgi:hypothetical protein